MKPLTHASFFSGVGGTDLGLEAAGWQTVSFSEADPYACAVLAERWPEVPNLGSIVGLADSLQHRADAEGLGNTGNSASSQGHQPQRGRSTDGGADWTGATLWSGGFPCQDLSVAGKRAGFTEGTRSSLAFAFLDLVAAKRPPLVLLENVPGLLSSNNGRDFRKLINTFQELRYVGFYRVLDAQHFGVPQRRRRVFIFAIDAFSGVTVGSAAAVLSVGTRCDRHPTTGGQSRAGVAGGATPSVDIIGTVPAALGHHGYTLGQEALTAGFLQIAELKARDAKGVGRDGADTHIVATADGLARPVVGANRYDDDTNTFLIGQTPDADRVRATDGLAGRPHDSDGLAAPRVTSGAEMIDGSGHHRERIATDVTPTLNGYSTPMLGGVDAVADDSLLPLGLDSHRYRCCGNGVVAPVAEWLGLRLARLATEL